MSTRVSLKSGAPGRVFWPGVLLGVGLGGFFDGIVLHQILQWHHLASSVGPSPATQKGLSFNTFLDGLFHAVTWLCTLAGIAALWSAARLGPLGSGKALVAAMLIGFGAFNLVEGVVNHQILGLHHVNETVPHDQWWLWDTGFLVWGALMVGGGGWLWRRERYGKIPRDDPAGSGRA